MLIRKDGVERAIDDSAAHKNDDGSIVGCVLCVFRDISERRQESKRAEIEIERLLANERKARAEVERTNRMKDEFLATLSHELRTTSSTRSWLRPIIEKNPGDVKIVKEGVQIITRKREDPGGSHLRSARHEPDCIRKAAPRHTGRDQVDVVNGGLTRSATARRRRYPSRGNPPAHCNRCRAAMRAGCSRCVEPAFPTRSSSRPVWRAIEATLRSEGSIANDHRSRYRQGIQPEMLPYLFEALPPGRLVGRRANTRGWGSGWPS
jgi:hypothetical protein